MRSLVHILPSGTVGGAPNNVIRIIDEVSALTSDYRHEVLVPFDSNQFITRLSKRNVKRVEIPRAKDFFRSAFKVFIYCLKRKMQGEDISVITHGRGAGFIYRPIARLLGYRPIHFYRGFKTDYTVSSRLTARVLKSIDRLLNRNSTVVAVGEDEYKLIRETLAPPNLFLVRNLVKKIDWSPREGTCCYDFAGVGRRSYQKGFDRFIELARKQPGLSFLWVGSEEDVLVSKSQIPPNMVISEYMPIAEVFGSANILLCLSRWEGCSTVLTECIVSSKPFVSLKCPGAGEFHVPKKNDRLFYNELSDLNEAAPELLKSGLHEEIGFTHAHFKDAMDSSVNAKKLSTIFAANPSDR